MHTSADDLARPPAAREMARTLPLLIAALSMIGPFAIDTYLPSFREMESSLRATPVQIQQSLTAFLVPFAFMCLWHGSLSDAFGRRKVILWSLAFVTISSVGCALAPNVQTLWFFRAVQGLAGGIFVVGRAVVRDVYEGPAALRVISQVSVLFGIAPAIAPVIGGFLHEWFGWRSVFVFLAIFSAGLMLWSALRLPETLPLDRRQPLRFRPLMSSYGRTLTHPQFLAAALAGAFNFTALFLYIASAPAFLLTHLGVPETRFFWLFGPVTAGMMLGGALSGRLAGRLDARHVLAWSAGLMITASAVNVVFHMVQPAQLPWSVAPLFFYATGMSLAMPTLALIGLDLFPEQRGLASSCQAFLLTGLNALTSGLLAPFASVAPIWLALTSAALMCIGLICTWACLPPKRAEVVAV
ncbi:MAG: drug resistance transporter, Bcr/CflA subfamily [Chthoniobacter sp.]|nr:drug resistance transporter, Bcr/CflA subfamily [Chthoniobacter sp.]